MQQAPKLAIRSPLSYRMGIDIGSVTAKVVVLGPQDEMIFSSYRRHRAETSATLCSILQEASELLGDVSINPMITGSAGMGVSERYDIPFVQEMIASAEVVKRLCPQVRTLIDIGGEDAKLIYFDRDGIPDMRMNGTCAGGTGAYIDEMAALLNVPVSELGALAESSTRVYSMASRCGVFGKTDVQNLLSREVAHPDIAASILHAVVLQTLATLARGIEPEPMILFSGGPLTFIPALRAAFIAELGLDPEHVLAVPHMELLTANGAALAQKGGRRPLRLSEFAKLMGTRSSLQPAEAHRLAPLFAGQPVLSRGALGRSARRRRSGATEFVWLRTGRLHAG